MCVEKKKKGPANAHTSSGSFNRSQSLNATDFVYFPSFRDFVAGLIKGTRPVARANAQRGRGGRRGWVATTGR